MSYGYRLSNLGLARVQEKIAEQFVGVKSHSHLAEALGLSRNTIRRILRQDKNNTTVSRQSIAEIFERLKLELTEGDVEVGDGAVENPFQYPLPIRRPEDFWGRRREVKMLRKAHLEPIPFQIIGERKIGKTSLIEYCRHHATQWHCQPTFLNGLEEKFHSEEGFCKQIVADLQLEDCNDCKSIAELNKQLVIRLDAAKKNEGLAPVIYLDDFPVFYKGIMKRESIEKHDNFWNGLRNIILHHDLRFITTTREPLAEVLRKHHNREFSEFMGLIAPLTLRGFPEAEAQEFVATTRPGEFAFKSEDQQLLLDHARQFAYHPIALQILCSFMFDARQEGVKNITEVLEEAGTEITQRLPKKESGKEED